MSVSLLISATLTLPLLQHSASAEIFVLEQPTPPPPTSAVLLQCALTSEPAFDPLRPSIVGYGDVITYTIVVANKTTLTQTNIVISDGVPLGTSIVPASMQPSPTETHATATNTTLTWRVDVLAANASYTASYAVRVNSTVTVTAIVNIAYVTSDQSPLWPSNTTVHVFDITKNPPRLLYYVPFYISNGLPISDTRRMP
jgi:uncharacterized repeat protein (TIGR01451 family)